MSNYLAVATVTKALAQILDAAVKSAVDGSGAVTQRPDPGTKTACVDLFLYQVTPNPALRNSDLPTRDAQGQVISRPTSALDLHYLMSFYGDDSKFEPQRMLGAVVRSLLAEPGLTRERILGVSKDDNGDTMNNSNLADAIEQVKFTPQNLSIDDLSRIWSIFYQVPYALSVALHRHRRPDRKRGARAGLAAGVAARSERPGRRDPSGAVSAARQLACRRRRRRCRPPSLSLLSERPPGHGPDLARAQSRRRQPGGTAGQSIFAGKRSGSSRNRHSRPARGDEALHPKSQRRCEQMGGGDLLGLGGGDDRWRGPQHQFAAAARLPLRSPPFPPLRGTRTGMSS